MILFFSDVHGIKDNLDKISFGKYKEIYYLGDLYGDFRKDEEIDEIFERIKDKTVCTVGNCDYPGIYDSLGFVPNDKVHFNIDGINIYASHGHEYRLKHNTVFEGMDVLIYGHEHIPYIKKVDKYYYICVGSVSKPRNEEGPSYLEYENNVFTLKGIDGRVIDQIEIKK